MSYNYRASKEGQFLLILLDHKNGEKLGEIYLSQLHPFQKLDYHVEMGANGRNQDEAV
jgi:hypothetical protein